MRGAPAACALIVVAAGTAVAQGGDSTRVAAVTYISGQSVYVAAGKADGVREGLVLEVFRAGAVIAAIRAQFLSSHSASCEVVAGTAAPAVGDSVRFHPVVDAPPSTAGAGADSGRAPAVRRALLSARRPIRGHVGLRYFRVDIPNGGRPAITQPSADVHVEATHLGDASVGFIVDGRSRRVVGTSDTAGGALVSQTRVYEASVFYSHGASGTRLAVGRQYSSALASVSLFDGFTVEVNRPRWGVGAFSGVQPDVVTMGFSTDTRELGGYLQLHSIPAGMSPWSITTGAVSSHELGQLNREFAFAQVVATGRVASIYATQEVDFNSGWKRAAGEPAVSPTSSFATVQLRPFDGLSFQGGVDNRRNVRLYRDYISPETEFDDAFREGVWGGADVTLFRRVRIGGDARVSRGGSAGAAEYYTGSFSLERLTRAHFDARVRATRFRTDRTVGWLTAWTLGAEPFRALRLEVNGGLRSQRALADSAAVLAAPAPLADAGWFGATVDVSIGRSWYVLISGTRDGSGSDLTRQIYASLVWRF